MPRQKRPFRWLYTLPLRVRSLLRGEQVECELHEELEYHIDRVTDANIAAGMTPRDARAAALRALGGVAQRMEESRDTRRVSSRFATTDARRHDLSHPGRAVDRISP